MKSVLTTAVLFFAFSPFASAQPDDFSLSSIRTERSGFYRAKVISASEPTTETVSGLSRGVQDVTLRIMTGPDAGKEMVVENGTLGGREDLVLSRGDTVVIEQWDTLDGGAEYFLREKYRLPPLIILTIIFLALAFIFGGRMGLQSVLGLFASLLVLAFFVVPRIIEGSNPLLISLGAAFFIAGTSIYLAHGFNRRTSIAVLSTVITLTLATILAIVFVNSAKLFGLGTEEAMFLQMGPTENINLRGLLLGGIIIGTLGILDDITTAQTAAVDELSRANPNLSFTDLYMRGLSIGREHIAALVNSLALAYVGTSLPVLILFTTQRTMPVWVIINGEFIAEEIVRTLVGSSTLLLAVPIATYLAARSFAHGRHTRVRGHAHVH